MCAMSMISNGKSFTIHVDTQHLLTNEALLVITVEKDTNGVSSEMALPPECRKSCANFTCSSVSPVPTTQMLDEVCLVRKKLGSRLYREYYCSYY